MYADDDGRRKDGRNTPSPGKNMKPQFAQGEYSILVVDDEPLVLQVLERELAQAGYRVVTARDGQEAIRKLYLDPVWGQDKFPDLIISDVMMPGIDGFHFCEKVKQNPKTRSIPFIFLSAKGGVAHKVSGFALGCQRYLVKPWTKDMLLKTVDLRLKDASQAREIFGHRPKIMNGSLKSVNIFSLMELFFVGRWTGKLHVSRGKDIGCFQFHNADIIGVSFKGLSGEDALEAILGLADGQFAIERE